jgi:hypothetical protein
MIRRITYRSAATAFVFTGLWFVLGLLLLWSPIPGSLGIRGQMLVAWLLLFLLIMATAGAMLTLASFNGIFPPAERASRARTSPARQPPSATEREATGTPAPWTQSPLPDRPARPTRGAAAVRPRPSERPPTHGR